MNPPVMATIEIEYRVPCGLLHTALRIEAALLDEFGRTLDELVLTTGTGGILAVGMDGTTVDDNRRDGPALDLLDLVGAVDRRPETAA